MINTYKPFISTALLILAFKTGFSALGLVPTRMSMSVSSIPVTLEFIKYWFLKSALRCGELALTST